MTKEELFTEFDIDESHGIWTQTDSFMFVELYRIMHNGKLPSEADTSWVYVIEFLRRVKSDMLFVSKLRKRVPDDFGSLYLTAKRIIFTQSVLVLADINKSKSKS